MRPRIGFIVALCLVLSACVTTEGGGASNIQPGERPALTSDEAGLWMGSEEVERRLATSGRVITDDALNDYVKAIICRLSPTYCGDIRFYIVRTPHFNASMHPNGFMQVWSGLMLRAENEAQLAYVLGHELGHYIQRHGVKQWRTVRDTASAMTFFQMAAAAAGVGYVGDIGYLAAMGALFAYSREFERDADDVGFELMANAGYDSREAAKIWEALLEEKEASDEPKGFIFFTTHPSTEERIETLREYAAKQISDAEVGDARHWNTIHPFLSEWLRDDLRNRKLDGSEVMLKRLIAHRSEYSDFYFYLGEIYRLRDDDGDPNRAVEYYRAALALKDAPVEAYRSLGLVHWHEKHPAKARAAFENYLRLAPQAKDHAMVKSYLETL